MSHQNLPALLEKLAEEFPAAVQEALAAVGHEKSELRASHCPSCPPPGFPPGIATQCATFENWSLAIDVADMCYAEVQSAQDIVDIANWAKGADYIVRAVGHRHNWAPLVIPKHTAPDQKIILVDTSKLNSMTFNPDPDHPTATFGTGVTIDDSTLFLQNQNNGNPSGAPGFTFQNFTAPGSLSLGGVLAIGGHGTGVPFSKNGTPVPEPSLNGCMSNLVTSFKAVVTMPGSDDYTLQEFTRDQADSAAFLVHLGRAFLTEVTLRVIPNYYLQVVNRYPQAADLFQAPTPTPSSDSISSMLDNYGRIEVIWFPFTDEPWVKTWELMDTKIEPQVTGPYNYPLINDIPVSASNAIKFMLQRVPGPSITPPFAKSNLFITQNVAAPASVVMNGVSRDLLLYVKDTTLRITAFAYALQVKRSQVQQVANQFYEHYTAKLNDYASQGKYPVNGPTEIRVTTMDYTDDLGVTNASRTALSVCRSIDPSDQDLDTVFWIDILTLPGTAHMDTFFNEMQTWMVSQWGQAGNNIIRPEWSKGWAYDAFVGAWSDQTFLTQTIPGEYNQPANDPVFTWAKQTLAKYDKHRIYTNALLDVLLPNS